MSDLVKRDGRDSSASLSSQLCEITGIGPNLAQTLLMSANDDLNVAVAMFFSDPDRNNQVPVVKISNEKDLNSNDKNMAKVDANDSLNDTASGSKDKDKDLNKDVNSNFKNMIKNNATESLEVNSSDVDNNANKASGSKDKGSNENHDVYDEEKMLEKALKNSEKEFQMNEPDPSETFRVLSENFPHTDSTALQKLCEEYKGRSNELEIFIQQHRHTLPTKIQAQKIELNAHLKILLDAGVEEAKAMMIEDCPACSKPKIVLNDSAKVFICDNLDCKGEFCRKCKKVQHIPETCGGQETKIKPWDDSQEFQIINMKAKRTYHEEDELDKEFRLAEGQFLRLKSIKNKKIQSIDLVYNKKLEAKFEAKKEELKRQGKVESLLVFHGTPQKNIRHILENNFDLTIVANGRAYGNGVYFSEQPEVSLGYSRDRKSLILCNVLKGDNCTEANPGKRKKGDEMTRSWAIVVPDVDQILPKYVINFS